MGRVGRYELEGELGRGGMGIVYRARDTELGRAVALKVIQVVDAEDRARFAREALAASAVTHPALLPVYDVGEERGRPFLVTALAAGSLADLLRTGPLEPRKAADLLAQVARGLAAAHAAGVVHRDLKPANVLLDAGGRPLLADFGLARRLQDETLTATGTVLGTPGYMAPEQARGERADARSDVYGLGALLYACLTAAPPFRRASPLLTLAAVAAEPPRPPRELVPAVPARLSELCLRALAKDPDERPPSADVFADELEAWLRATEGAGERQRGPRLALAGLAVLTLGLLSGLWAVSSRGPLDGGASSDPGPSAGASAAGPGSGSPTSGLLASLLPRDDLELFGHGTTQEELLSLRDRVRAQVEADPQAAWAQVDLARVLLALGELDAAEAAAERALALEPRRGDAYRVRGMIKERRQPPRYVEAQVDLERAVRANPADWQALRERGMNNMNLGRAEAALADLADSLALRPSAGTHRARGFVLASLARVVEAEAEFVLAFGLDPHDLDATKNAALLARGRGDLAKASEYQAHYLEERPNELEALDLQIDLLWRLGRYGPLLELVERAEAIKPRRRTQFLHAAALLELGRREEAEAATERLLEQAPRDPEFLMLGMRVQTKLERWDRVVELCDRLLALSPQEQGFGEEQLEKVRQTRGYAAERVNRGR
ncbi:MAG: protein kinase [Planctomycetota bacterium]